LHVREQERTVPDGRRVAAQRYGAAHPVQRARHVAAEQPSAIVDIERVFAADPEGDG
jgi:hypothetical protein